MKEPFENITASLADYTVLHSANIDLSNVYSQFSNKLVANSSHIAELGTLVRH